MGENCDKAENFLPIGATLFSVTLENMFGSFGVSASNLPNNDFALLQPPEDTITSIAFSPAQNHVAAGGWGKEVRIWEYTRGTTETKHLLTKAFFSPILSVSFSPDGNSFFAAGCDKTCYMTDMRTEQVVPAAQHDAPIKYCKYLADVNVLITGGWDKTLRYWDLRTNKPAATVALPDKVLAMDATNLISVATPNRQVILYDVKNPTLALQTIKSPMELASTCIANFSTNDGFCLGSVAGRAAIQYVDNKSKNFAFKCHRQENLVYAVNALAFHPNGSFATAGGDGLYHFWDKDAKVRLKAFQNVGSPITACAFDRTGEVFCYAMGYDWSLGVRGAHDPRYKFAIHMHNVQPDEVRRRGQQTF